MNRNSIITTINQLGALASQHLPVILGAVGTVMTVGAVVSAVDTVPKVPEKIQEKKNEKGRDLTLVEKGAVVAKTCHTPLALTVGSVACNWAAIGISYKRISALSALYLLERSTNEEAKEAAQKIFGSGKTEKARIQAVEDKLDRALQGNPVIVDTQTGDDFIFMPSIGLMYKGNADEVRQIFNDLDHDLHSRSDGTVSLSDLIAKLKERTNAPVKEFTFGQLLGWNHDDIATHVHYDPSKCRIPREESSILRNGHAWVVFDFMPVPIGEWKPWDFYDNQFLYY